MPVRKVDKGYKFGKTGKVYKSREKAEKQAKAIYASGYKENTDMKDKKKYNVGGMVGKKPAAGKPAMTGKTLAATKAAPQAAKGMAKAAMAGKGAKGMAKGAMQRLSARPRG